MKGTALLLSFAATVSIAARAVHGADALHRTIVQVEITSQMQDPLLPWQAQPFQQAGGFGVAVASNLVLTTESLVRGCRNAELRLPGQGRKIEARVIEKDAQANLALLSIQPRPENLLSPVHVMKGLIPTSSLEIAALDRTLRIQRSPAMLRASAVERIPGAPYFMLQHAVVADMHTEDSGLPLLTADGLLAGLVMDYRRADRTAMVAPAAHIARFLAESGAGGFAGMASAGFTWQPLLDPAHRRSLGLDPLGPGILVLSTLVPPGTEEPVLRDDDVVMKWDGFEIDSTGFYEDTDLGRTSFAYLLNGRTRPGDRSKVDVLREGSMRSLDVPLYRFSDTDALVPENVEGNPEPYIVASGMVLRELSARYLYAFGSDWQTKANVRLAHAYTFRRMAPDRPGDRIVILSHVLPDDANNGYQHLRDEIVTGVNGEPVRNLNDVFALLGPASPIASLQLKGIGVDVSLDPSEAAASDARISAKYRIPAEMLRFRPDVAVPANTTAGRSRK
ncbi:MAG: serine protease [Lentisphaerae bacterium]|nr:serine protease [Lentisphaerota bacterium]